jgi:UDPglucose 6-dehydrogenase
MNIGIIGQGFVGSAVYKKFKNYYDVFTFDIDQSKCNSNKDFLFENCEIIFVCLPTPMNSDESCNIDLVENTIKEINNLTKNKIVIVKSTIIPGTTEYFNKTYSNLTVVFNPEFLTEKNADKDYNSQTRIILGGPRPATTKLKQVFSNVFPDAHIIKTDSTHAEMVKYVTNTFLSVKVSFANEIYQLCSSLNIDYDKVIEYATYDQRIGTSHWAVPGPDGDFGFGGHCFPKDLSALIHLSQKHDCIHEVLLATKNTNLKVRTNKDWENMKGRAVI